MKSIEGSMNALREAGFGLLPPRQMSTVPDPLNAGRIVTTTGLNSDPGLVCDSCREEVGLVTFDSNGKQLCAACSGDTTLREVAPLVCETCQRPL